MSDMAFNGFDNFDTSVNGMDSVPAAEKKDNRVKIIKVIVTILAVIFSLEIFVYLFLKPAMSNVVITWSGLTSYEPEALMRVIEPAKNRNIVRFSSSEIKSLLSGVSGIENVEIEKHFPNSVVINVTERKSVAMTFIESNGKTIPVQIDKNGVLFINQKAAYNSSASIPLISGIPVENIPEGMRIPQKYRDLMGQIAYIQSLKQPYFSAISEIHVVPKDFGNYELILYPVHSRTKVFTGRQLKEEELQYIMVALDAVNTLEPDVELIDFRYGTIAYKSRNSSGDTFER